MTKDVSVGVYSNNEKKNRAHDQMRQQTMVVGVEVQPDGREKQVVSRKISMAELIEKEQKKNRLPEQRKKNLPEERKTVQKNSNSRTAEELQRKSYVPTA